MKKKTYRINFSKEVYTRFVEKNKAYYKKHNLFNEDNTVNFEKISKHFASLHDLIRSQTSADKLLIMPKIPKTDLYELLL